MTDPDNRASRIHDATRERTTATAGDRQIVYAEYGRPNGAPVVFLHGTPGSHRLGALLHPAARANDVRIIAPSRPGYSASSPWPNRSLHDTVDSILPVLDDAGVRTAGLVGFSGGGPHALAMASERPHRVARVDLVSGATPPEVSAETPGLQRLLGGLATRTPAILRSLFGGQAWAASRLDPSFVVSQYTADGSAVSDDTAELVRADLCEAFARHRSGAVTDLRNAATIWEFDYKAISPEVRVWHGRLDTNVPIGDARRFANALPGAELRVSADADHLQTLLRSAADVLECHRRAAR